jgi:hypothetical protein
MNKTNHDKQEPGESAVDLNDALEGPIEELKACMYALKDSVEPIKDAEVFELIGKLDYLKQNLSNLLSREGVSTILKRVSSQSIVDFITEDIKSPTSPRMQMDASGLPDSVLARIESEVQEAAELAYQVASHCAHKDAYDDAVMTARAECHFNELDQFDSHQLHEQYVADIDSVQIELDAQEESDFEGKEKRKSLVEDSLIFHKFCITLDEFYREVNVPEKLVENLQDYDFSKAGEKIIELATIVLSELGDFEDGRPSNKQFELHFVNYFTKPIRSNWKDDSEKKKSELDPVAFINSLRERYNWHLEPSKALLLSNALRESSGALIEWAHGKKPEKASSFFEVSDVGLTELKNPFIKNTRSSLNAAQVDLLLKSIAATFERYGQESNSSPGMLEIESKDLFLFINPKELKYRICRARLITWFPQQSYDANNIRKFGSTISIHQELDSTPSIHQVGEGQDSQDLAEIFSAEPHRAPQIGDITFVTTLDKLHYIDPLTCESTNTVALYKNRKKQTDIEFCLETEVSKIKKLKGDGYVVFEYSESEEVVYKDTQIYSLLKFLGPKFAQLLKSKRSKSSSYLLPKELVSYEALEAAWKKICNGWKCF